MSSEMATIVAENDDMISVKYKKYLVSTKIIKSRST